MLEPAAGSQSETSSTTRLVIRIKLIPQPPPVRRRWSGTATLLILGAIAVPLSWLGISTFGAGTEESRVASNESLPMPAIETTVMTPAKAEHEPVESEVQPPSAVDEVLPDVPRSALETIRGTVRVSVRVTVDNQGSVTDAAAHDRGPSRYFERLAVDAAKKWTFTPAHSEAPRTAAVKFNFTRAGVTAQADFLSNPAQT